MTGSIGRRGLIAGLTGAAAVPALGGCALRTEALPNGLRMMIPNSAGSGYDQTGRAVARTLEEHEITERVEVFNVLGAGGTVALARLLNERANPDLLMTMGLGLLGATYAHDATVRVGAATPVARLIEEAEGVVVKASSPYASLGELLRAWRAAPGKIVVGGGSFPGGPDHLFTMELARTAGIAPDTVEFRSHDGGGRLLSSVLGDQVAFATSGLAELHQQIESGQLRVLATSGAVRERARPQVPTLSEEGLDLIFTNWRGLLAPPGLARDAVARLTDLLSRMRNSDGWTELLRSRSWDDAWLVGEEFADYTRSQERRVRTTLRGLGD